MRPRTFLLLGALLALYGCRSDLTAPAGSPAEASAGLTVPAAAATDSAILIVAGDMHATCRIRGRQSEPTAAIIRRYSQALVIPMGDNAGYHAAQAAYFRVLRADVGEFKDRTYATIRNHELNQDPVGARGACKYLAI